MSAWLLAAILFGQSAPQVSEQKRVDAAGQISFLADSFPRRDVAEARAQASIDLTVRPSRTVRLKFDGFVEGLAADRSGVAAIARVREAWFEVAGAKGDVRAGYGRVIWGRLDEIQPSDVINPLDTSRYLFDGRSAARLPVVFLRGRLFASEALVIEGVAVPAFRRGTFDELDEPTSPFNLVHDAILPAVVLTEAGIRRKEPEFALKNMSGGGRVSGTVGRVDLAAGVFRGFEGFGVTTFVPELASEGFLPQIGPAIVGHLEQAFPRFTMVSADFETVAGEWALRGEAAYFVEKTFLRSTGAGTVDGKAIDAGVGVDRRTGEYRVFASAILHREWSARDAGIERTDVNLVGSIEREFGRDRWLARAFAVVNPSDASGFVRGLIVWRAADNVAIEGSAAAFVGDGDDTLARFKTRDFLLTRVRWRF